MKRVRKVWVEEKQIDVDKKMRERGLKKLLSSNIPTKALKYGNIE